MRGFARRSIRPCSPLGTPFYNPEIPTPSPLCLGVAALREIEMSGSNLRLRSKRNTDFSAEKATAAGHLNDVMPELLLWYAVSVISFA
jgi:hypothetical protein